MVAGFAALALCASVANAIAAPDEHAGADRPGAHEHWRRHSCIEPFARLNGRLGYLEIKLSLTAAQRPLWDTWRAAVADGAGKVQDVCLKGAATPDAHPTIVERLAHIQEKLATEAAGLQAAQPSLAALYEALTTEQRELFERGLKIGHGHHRHHRDRDRDRHGKDDGHSDDGHGDGRHHGDHGRE
jgi:hypothetical protein